MSAKRQLGLVSQIRFSQMFVICGFGDASVFGHAGDWARIAAGWMKNFWGGFSCCALLARLGVIDSGIELLAFCFP